MTKTQLLSFIEKLAITSEGAKTWQVLSQLKELLVEDGCDSQEMIIIIDEAIRGSAFLKSTISESPNSVEGAIHEASERERRRADARAEAYAMGRC